MGDQKTERGQRRIPEMKRRAEAPGFIPGDGGAQNAQRKRQNQKGTRITVMMPLSVMGLSVDNPFCEVGLLFSR